MAQLVNLRTVLIIFALNALVLWLPTITYACSYSGHGGC